MDTKPAVSIIESKCKEAEYARVIWQAIPDATTAFEDVLKPEYWANVAQKMRPLNRIEVIAEDSGYFAELIVLDVGRTYAKVELLRKVDFGKRDAITEGDEYDVSFNPHKKWRVIRRSDKVVMAEELATKEDGMAWVINHNKKAA